MCVLMTVHCAQLFLGYESLAVHAMFISFLLLLGLKLSQIFNLCFIHKLSVIYSLSVIMCTIARRCGIFELLGIDLHTARGVMFVVGIIICMLNLWRITNKSCLKSC